MRAFLYLSISLVFLFPAGAGEDDLQTKRFTRWTNIISEALSAGNADAVADELLEGLHRVAAFNLQALGRIYQHTNSYYFNQSIRSEFKLIEDSIGEFKKWRDLLDNAINQGASDNKIENFKKKKKAAKIELKYLLTADKDPMKDYVNSFNGEEKERLKKRFKKYRKRVSKHTENSQFADFLWIPESTEAVTKLQAIESSLINREWGNYDEDRDVALSGLIKQLKVVRDEDSFSFDVLENEKAGSQGRTENKSGIHEFRREVRWFNLQADSLGGLVAIESEKIQAVKDVIAAGGTQAEINQAAAPLQDSCPVEAFKPYVTEKKMIKNKYTQLSPNPNEKVCTISTCLYYAMAKIVSQVGKVKDFVEEQHSLSDDGVIECRDGSTEDYTPEKYNDHWNNVPQCIQKEVQATYDYNIKDNGLLNLLIGQLEACK